MEDASSTPAADLAFIFGIMPRSGTNYLRDLICLHPDCKKVWPIHEDYSLAYAEPPLIDYIESLSRFWTESRQFEEVPGFDRCAELYRCLGDGIIAFFQSLHNHLAALKSSAGASGRPKAKKLLAKTPSVKGLPFFFKFFPRAHLIIIIRDGRSVVESSMVTFKENNLERFTIEWAEAAQAILAFDKTMREAPHKDQYLIVRYEDLVSSTNTALEKILRFLGLDTQAYDFDAANVVPVRGSSELAAKGGQVHWQPVAKHSEFSPITRWSGWSQAQHDTFNAIAGELLKQFGYTSKT